MRSIKEVDTFIRFVLFLIFWQALQSSSCSYFTFTIASTPFIHPYVWLLMLVHAAASPACYIPAYYVHSSIKVSSLGLTHRRQPPKPLPLADTHPKASNRFKLATALLNSSCSLSIKTRHNRKSNFPSTNISRSRRMHNSSASPSIETKPALFSAIETKQSCVKGGGL